MPSAAATDPYALLERLACIAEMQAMDAYAIQTLGLPGRVLMENAAAAVATAVCAALGPDAAAAPVVVCCGSGNNGGDGYAVARLLANRGLAVTVVALGTPTGGDAAANAQAWAHFGATLAWPREAAAARGALDTARVVVDALFGTGLGRAVADDAATLIEAINGAAGHRGVPVVGVDIPSGVQGDTGQVLGQAVRCTQTVSFQVAQPGLYQHPGAEYAGAVTVAPISIPPRWAEDAPLTARMTAACAAALLPPRPAAGHKGTFGHLLTVCGSAGMGGAGVLAATAALKVGTGLVTAGVPHGLRDAYLGIAPELMTLAAADDPGGHFAPEHAAVLLAAAAERDAVVLGCGLGRHPATGTLVQRLAAEVTAPLLIDADGLYALGPEHLRARSAPTVITPHPGELARLAGLERTALAADRLETARRLARDWGVVLVLKGAATVVAAPDGTAVLNGTGDQGLASGGTGDVLSGIIGGLLAQGLEPLPAALLGTYLHGLARDVQRPALSAAYFSATDLIAGLNPALQRLGAA